jgi:hypothetical protein
MEQGWEISAADLMHKQRSNDIGPKQTCVADYACAYRSIRSYLAEMKLRAFAGGILRSRHSYGYSEMVPGADEYAVAEEGTWALQCELAPQHDDAGETWVIMNEGM